MSIVLLVLGALLSHAGAHGPPSEGRQPVPEKDSVRMVNEVLARKEIWVKSDGKTNHWDPSRRWVIVRLEPRENEDRIWNAFNRSKGFKPQMLASGIYRMPRVALKNREELIDTANTDTLPQMTCEYETTEGTIVLNGLINVYVTDERAQKYIATRSRLSVSSTESDRLQLRCTGTVADLLAEVERLKKWPFVKSVAPAYVPLAGRK